MAAKKKANKGKRTAVLRAYVGSFTPEASPSRKARGDGVHIYDVNLRTGALIHREHVGGLESPSFLIVNDDQTRLYSMHADARHASAFAIDPARGSLREINRVETGGVNGVRQMIDRSGRFMVGVNYSSGSVVVLPLTADGSLAAPTQLYQIPGQPGEKRWMRQQEISHPHDVMFDPSGRFVAVPDKGLDRVLVFRFDSKAGRVEPANPPFVAGRSGAGPRHIAFHPKLPVAWVANEMDSTVSTYRWNKATGTLTPLGVALTLPGDFNGENTSSEIMFHAPTRTLYVSNRGHDSLALYRTDARTGLPTPIGWQTTYGQGPRHFAIEPTGRFLYACNEQSDTVVTFRIDPRSGKLARVGKPLRNVSPACIAFTYSPVS